MSATFGLETASDFTPWLYGNLDLLGEAIRLPLTPEGMEHPIGGYRLDILAKDSLGHHVAIENQVEPADHSHLGQLLLYAAHVDADPPSGSRPASAMSIGRR